MFTRVFEDDTSPLVVGGFKQPSGFIVCLQSIVKKKKEKKKTLLPLRHKQHQLPLS